MINSEGIDHGGNDVIDTPGYDVLLRSVKVFIESLEPSYIIMRMWDNMNIEVASSGAKGSYGTCG